MDTTLLFLNLKLLNTGMKTTEVDENIDPDLRQAQKSGGIKTIPSEYLNLTTLQILIPFTGNNFIFCDVKKRSIYENFNQFWFEIKQDNLKKIIFMSSVRFVREAWNVTIQ